MGTSPNHPKAVSLGPDRVAAIKVELSAILKSSNFSGSKRCQDFLEFIVNQALDGNYDFLTERFLGAELFGRPINYETGSDSIVRVRANDVRRRLAQYYADGHGGAQVAIELVSGSYVPEFHWHEPKNFAMAPADSPVLKADHSPDPAHEPATTTLRVASSEMVVSGPGWRLAAILIVIALIIGSSAGWWLRQQTLGHSLNPLLNEPSVSTLWAPFDSPAHETDIVLSDVSFQLLEDIEKRSFTLNDYLNRKHLSPEATHGSSQDLQPVLSLVASKNFGNSSEFRLAERMLALDPIGGRVHIYNARDYSSALAGQDNMILIGSQYTNPWQQLFAARLNFKENPPGVNPGIVMNSSPKPGENAVYSPTDATGYCVVAYLPNPDRDTRALLIEGTSSEATEAGGDFLLSEDKFSGFEKILQTSGMQFFEVLLKTSQVRGTPITASIEAYRTYPGKP